MVNLMDDILIEVLMTLTHIIIGEILSNRLWEVHSSPQMVVGLPRALFGFLLSNSGLLSLS